MRASFELGPAGARLSEADRVEIDLLAAQLGRMRGMLFGYSERFFERVRTWTLVTLVLLVAGWTEPLRPAGVLVPFVVPFAFLETGYLFSYTVFARRHAERLEQAINGRLGRTVLVAHELEAAYFYPPEAPKVAAFSFGNPSGFMSAMTAGYTVGAGLLWVAGLITAAAYLDSQGVQPFVGLPGLVLPVALAWTGAITGYLIWTFLVRRDERRLERALDAGYAPAEREARGRPSSARAAGPDSDEGSRARPSATPAGGPAFPGSPDDGQPGSEAS